MAILRIARMGHPVLSRPAARVKDPSAPDIRALVADMVETMEDAPGVGLAAPQVHHPVRVVVYWVPAARARPARYGGEGGDSPEDGPQPLTVLINPEIEPLTDEMVEGLESCLSLPGLSGMVLRYTRVRVRATGPHGEALDYVAGDFHARVVQHECDHLDGILYPMRMRDLSTFGYEDEKGRGRSAAEPTAETAEVATADAAAREAG